MKRFLLVSFLVSLVVCFTSCESFHDPNLALDLTNTSVPIMLNEPEEIVGAKNLSFSSGRIRNTRTMIMLIGDSFSPEQVASISYINEPLLRQMQNVFQ
ncbi:MAG: hypothetical protein PQJ46_01615, partial [Spirochaetales bacterium]|nr:hypothetical protein [Spirochaetales bacterium]